LTNLGNADSKQLKNTDKGQDGDNTYNVYETVGSMKDFSNYFADTATDEE
jgi:hypothetical protein